MLKKYLLEQTCNGFDLHKWVELFPDYKSQLKKLRESSNMTQEQLAKLVDRTPRCIRTIENGEAYPRITTLENISNSLNADLILMLVPKENNNTTPDHESKGDTTVPKKSHQQPIITPVEVPDIVFGEND